jgi:radical SAM superfamily enzyme YgiQ (UPF0313 family)
MEDNLTKVLLIYPVPTISSPQLSPPLSILHVGEALKLAKSKGKSDEDYEVRYFDERYDSNPDLDWPDVVGVSSMTGYQLKGAIHYLKEAKKHGKRTILGGIHVSMYPEQCLEEPYIDSIVVSEGEWAILDAIHGERVAMRHLKGVEDHISPVTPETLIHFQRSSQAKYTILLSSRGCPFRCGFCFVQKFYQRKWQSTDLDRWKHDILYLKEHAGLTSLEHGDDWIGKWDRASEIIRFLSDNGIKYKPSFRAHQINDDVAKEMSELGITTMSIGMESGSQRILDLVQKDITTEDQVRCATALAKYGIHPQYYWITGFPTETREEFNATVNQADLIGRIHKGKLTQTIYTYTALPGTPLFEMVDPDTIPKNLEGWINYTYTSNSNKLASNLCSIGGLHYHRTPGDKTDTNFPGPYRIFIAPFELMSAIRWKLRWFTFYDLEKLCIDKLLALVSYIRYRKNKRRNKKVNLI